MEILKTENKIHLMDGRYSGGNIPVLVLVEMIPAGLVEEFTERGQTFVRARRRKQFEVA